METFLFVRFFVIVPNFDFFFFLEWAMIYVLLKHEVQKPARLKYLPIPMGGLQQKVLAPHFPVVFHTTC
jgi:hypothetical protein